MVTFFLIYRLAKNRSFPPLVASKKRQAVANSLTSIFLCLGIFGLCGSAAAEIQTSITVAASFSSRIESGLYMPSSMKIATKCPDVANLFL